MALQRRGGGTGGSSVSLSTSSYIFASNVHFPSSTFVTQELALLSCLHASFLKKSGVIRTFDDKLNVGKMDLDVIGSS